MTSKLWLLLQFCLSLFHVALVDGQNPLSIDRSLLDAMKQVESGGNACARGDNGRSLGAYQIMEGYYMDALQFNPSLADGGKTYNNVWGIGSEPYSERVISNYMGRYATPERLGRQPTFEDIARIHNGGPNGYRKTATMPYWSRMMDELQRQQRNGRQTSTRSGNQCNPTCLQGQCCSTSGDCNCLTSLLTIQRCSTQSGTNDAHAITNMSSSVGVLVTVTILFIFATLWHNVI